jgi:hypothetical protein
MSDARRIGETVRRPAGAWTNSVHDLLRFVQARGVGWVPLPRGFDDEGRGVVEFFEGDVPAYPMPEWVWDEEVLVAAARFLRQYHDATVDFPRAGRVWRLPPHEPVEVICHNDFAPYNFVFRDRALHAVIDFDTASPGPRAWDVAYLAYRLVPLAAASNPDVPRFSAKTRARRLRRLCAEYGRDPVAPAAVLATAPGRLEELAALATAGLRTPPDHARLYRADAAYIRSAAAALLAD